MVLFTDVELRVRRITIYHKNFSAWPNKVARLYLSVSLGGREVGLTDIRPVVWESLHGEFIHF